MAKQRFPTKEEIAAGAARIREQNKAIGVGCAVCGALVGSGGRKSTPAACARCYKREQRKLPPMRRTIAAELLEVKLEVHVTKQLDAAVHRAANRAGVTVPEFLRRTLEHAVAGAGYARAIVAIKQARR